MLRATSSRLFDGCKTHVIVPTRSTSVAAASTSLLASLVCRKSQPSRRSHLYCDETPVLKLHSSFYPQRYVEPPRRLTPPEYVVLDIESTGYLEVENTRITEFAAIKVRNDQVVDSLTMLVDPKQPIPPKIADLTGITDEMIRSENAKPIEDVFPEIRSFIRNQILVAHNASFDIGFLSKEAQLIGDEVGRDEIQSLPSVCTLQLSRKLGTPTVNHRLETLARHFEIQNGSGSYHRALYDTHVCWKVFQHLCAQLGLSRDCTYLDLETFLRGRKSR